MRTLASLFCLAVATGASPVAGSPARPNVDQVLDSLSQLVEFRGVAISPDGSRIAWVEAVRGKDGPLSDRSIIFVAARDAAGAAPQRSSARKLGRTRHRLVTGRKATRLPFGCGPAPPASALRRRPPVRPPPQADSAEGHS